MDTRRLTALILLSLSGLVVACADSSMHGSGVPAKSAESGSASSFVAASPAFADGATIPTEYAMPAAGGRNVSVPLDWKRPPAGTRSFALEVVDLNPVAHSWVHWLVVDIPSDASGVSAGASGRSMPHGARELKNGFGRIGWGGPQPPAGTGPHAYRFTVLALGTPRLDVPIDVPLERFQQDAAPHVLGSASFVGTLER